MCVLLGVQDVLDLVNGNYTLVVVDVTEVQKNVQREMGKKDQKALFYIHQCVDVKMFEKIIDSTTVKDA